MSAESARDFIADRDAALAHHHERGDAPSGKSRQRRREQWPRVRFDRARGQAVGDHEYGVLAAPGMCCEPRGVLVREAAAEVGAHEVMRAIGGGARDREHGEGERRELGDEARFVELRVHGVACARVGEAEIKLWGSGERGAGARQRNARGGQRAQLRPRLILRRGVCAGRRWSRMAYDKTDSGSRLLRSSPRKRGPRIYTGTRRLDSRLRGNERRRDTNSVRSLSPPGRGLG
jgi:hypothetical protein